MTEPSDLPLRRNTWSAPLWQAAIHFGVILGLVVFFGAVVPPFAKMFMEFDLPVPAVSVLACNLSIYLVQRWFFALPLLAFLFACDVALLFALRLVPRSGRQLGGLWFTFVLISLGLIAIAGIVGIVLPLVSLQQGLAR